ncbi:hypothetical protein BD310DRAFT_933170 [Dichomitus squalens]|uniref:Uncharacterized protein n=1 Tax=Dichomitus squalens TaxID=114155 RepID=A0A4Q9PNI2_9APHY|nr:hypothetical protein BD310DRAFT_933170 [Dichomitus squalens]
MSELVVIALTLNKHHLSRGMSPKGGSALLRILLKNGLICFVSSVTLNGVMLAVDSTEWQVDGGLISVSDVLGSYRNALTTIILSRFLLDLGALRLNTDTVLLDASGEAISTQFTVHRSDVPSAANPPDWHAIEFWRSEISPIGTLDDTSKNPCNSHIASVYF